MQHAILQGLHEDHINMSKVAELIAAELGRIEAGNPANFDLLEDIMAYVTAYPDTYHHPAEDIIFARLRAAAPEARADIDALLAEHAALIERGRAFLKLVKAVEEEAVVTRTELLATGRSYLELLTGHMNKEEAGLFRVAADRLGPADWEAIAARVGSMEDPLFGATVATDYRRLWQRITSHPPSR